MGRSTRSRSRKTTRSAGSTDLAPRDVQHVRVGIAEIDPLRLDCAEPRLLQSSGERCRRLVAERLAERQPELRGERLLRAVPGVLDARGWVVLLHEERAARAPALLRAGQQRVPLLDRNLVEDVVDGDDVERAADRLVEADDEMVSELRGY